MNIDPKTYLRQWADRYKQEVTENIMPFWMKHGVDYVNGGVYTCLNRDGSLMDTTKSVWFQGRFAYICAYAYNHIERNREWLEASKSTIDFIEAHCFDTDRHMFFFFYRLSNIHSYSATLRIRHQSARTKHTT